LSLCTRKVLIATSTYKGSLQLVMEIIKSTYSQQVVKYIIDCIIRGELSPGDKVKEIAIANKLSISRAPIREALEILTQEGLLTSEPQKGKHITALTSKQILDNYFIAGVLQGAAVSSTIHKFTSEDFQRLDEIVKNMETITCEDAEIEHIATLDDEFHAILLSKNENNLLTDLSWKVSHRITKSLLFRYWKNLYTNKEIHNRHKLILDTVKQGDPWAVEECIREHYRENGRRLFVFGIDKTAERI
jgi:GntR family transcriptional regulator, rspAB operon transcriptional repressor